MSSEFHREEVAAEVLREERWSGDIICVKCGSNNVVKNGLRDDSVQQYNCNNCGRSFNDRSDTLFDKTQMSLTECMYIIYNLDEESVRALSKEIDRSWKTVNDFIRVYNSSLISDNLVEQYVQRASENVDYSLFGCGGNLYRNKKRNHLQI